MKTVLKITSLGASGEGVGSLEGLKVFVEGALPDETVEVELHTIKKNYALGTLEKILHTSSERETPPCPLFGECGGCQLMHLSNQGQLRAKQQRVIDSLERIGGFRGIEVATCIPSPRFLHYRNKIQLPIVWSAKGKKIGLFRKRSHEIIPIKRCLIQDSLGEMILSHLLPLLKIPALRHLLIRTTVSTNEALVILVTNGTQETSIQSLAESILRTVPSVKGVIENINKRRDNVILGTHFRTLCGRSYLEEIVAGKRFRFSAPSFFQINPLQAEQLYQTALRWADIQPSDVVVDAFCGVGALALFAADHSQTVFGIECVPHAIEDAKENARMNGKQCTFLCGSAETLLPTLPHAQTVFLNPPRSGCEDSLLHYLGKHPSSTLIYISCDPATLARDLKLLSSYGYQIESVQPFDMFPQTMHVETLVKCRHERRLERN